MKKSLIDFLIESWHLSFARASFFLFGFISVLPVLILNLFLSEWNSSFESLYSALATHPLAIILVLISAILVALLGKSLLIIQLNSQAENHRPASVFPLFAKSTFIEGAIILFMVASSLFILLPTLMANAVLGFIPRELTLLSTGLLLFVAFVVMILREYSLMYSLLTPLRFRSTLEAASKLYIRYQFPSLLFGLFLLLVTVVFTFFSNLVMLGIVALLQNLSIVNGGIAHTLGTTLLLSGYAVFEQALWITFFRSIAQPPKSSSTGEAAPLVGEMDNVPEITL